MCKHLYASRKNTVYLSTLASEEQFEGNFNWFLCLKNDSSARSQSYTRIISELLAIKAGV